MPDWLDAQPKRPSERLCTVSVAHHTSVHAAARVTVIVYGCVVAPSCAVTVTVSVLGPTMRSSSATPSVPVSSSFAMATVALLSFFVAVSVTVSIPLATNAA